MLTGKVHCCICGPGVRPFCLLGCQVFVGSYEGWGGGGILERKNTALFDTEETLAFFFSYLLMLTSFTNTNIQSTSITFCYFGSLFLANISIHIGFSPHNQNSSALINIQYPLISNFSCPPLNQAAEHPSHPPLSQAADHPSHPPASPVIWIDPVRQPIS